MEDEIRMRKSVPDAEKLQKSVKPGKDDELAH